MCKGRNIWGGNKRGDTSEAAEAKGRGRERGGREEGRRTYDTIKKKKSNYKQL